jgi:hypothetical protein
MVAYAVASAAVRGTPVAPPGEGGVSPHSSAVDANGLLLEEQRIRQVDVDLVLRHASDAAYADLGEMQTKSADSYDSFETVVHRQPDAVVLPPLLAETPGEILEQGDWQRRLDDGSIRTQIGLDQGEIAVHHRHAADEGRLGFVFGSHADVEYDTIVDEAPPDQVEIVDVERVGVRRAHQLVLHEVDVVIIEVDELVHCRHRAKVHVWIIEVFRPAL